MNRSSLRLIITVLTISTATIHLGLAPLIRDDLPGLFIPFILNGIGYLVLLWALLRPPAFLAGRSTLVHLAFIAFTLMTIVMYFVFNGFKLDDYLGLLDKFVEILLVIALVFHLRQSA
jgi:hypothetical protein